MNSDVESGRCGTGCLGLGEYKLKRVSPSASIASTSTLICNHSLKRLRKASSPLVAGGGPVIAKHLLSSWKAGQIYRAAIPASKNATVGALLTPRLIRDIIPMEHSDDLFNSGELGAQVGGRKAYIIHRLGANFNSKLLQAVKQVSNEA